jgi:UDP-3-O-[3-hydroxymyristoyl] glucosamine N-acyltransferase
VIQGAESSRSITCLGEPLDFAEESIEGSLAFLISESFTKDIQQTKAEVVVLQASLVEKLKGTLPASVKVCISSPDAYVGFAQLSQAIALSDARWDWAPHKADSIHPDAKVHPTATVSTGVVVGEGSVIGARSVILPNAVIAPHVRIGEDCKIFPGTVVYPHTQIGNRVRIHANVVVGSDGFGYARSPKGAIKIWHLGAVRIEDDVEIGAGTMIDRGTLKDTIIESGAKIDNLVQVGHNGHIKAHAILCAQVGMAGNVTIGRGAILAGKVGVADKLEIGDGALVGPMSGLSKDVKAGDQVMGQQPARPRREWWKLIAYFERLPELFDRVKKLERGGGSS